VRATEGDTSLSLKALTPVRLLHNPFSQQVFEAERRGASTDELKNLLGRGRAKKGMFEGDLEEGELEIGQVSALVHDVLSAAVVVQNLMKEFDEAFRSLQKRI
jgi:enoyl-[acyl-carrier protein] reductase II